MQTLEKSTLLLFSVPNKQRRCVAVRKLERLEQDEDKDDEVLWFIVAGGEVVLIGS